jgi:hypothetical protein
MNAGRYSPLLAKLSQNWRAKVFEFSVEITDCELDLEEHHPVYGEVISLCSGRSASLPFFAKDNEVVWCTVAPDHDSLMEAITSLQAWVIPSFGGEQLGDGCIQPEAATGALASAIISVSPSGYYKWRCPYNLLSPVCDKLRLRHGLESVRPARTRPPRHSLYELRARFAAALLVGDRNGAEEIIQLLDSLQLETAVNTQFMRIRMWQHFAEHHRIRTHPDLPHLLAQPLPPRVRAWIDEALDDGTSDTPKEVAAPTPVATKAPPDDSAESRWLDWFKNLSDGDGAAAETFLAEHRPILPEELKPAEISALVTEIEELYIDDALRDRERHLIAPGLGEFLEEFVREPEFPRSGFGDLYLALLRVWSALHAGNSSGQQHGHVLLELANATLQLNIAPGEVLTTIEHWWEAKPSRSQLPFALDAIELLEREFPDPSAPANLWRAAADIILRYPDALVASERTLWRRVAGHLDFDEATVNQYLPAEKEESEHIDPLADKQFRQIAIVCMREQQARDAATQIATRSGAKITLVTGKTAGEETDHARKADVVLFVWMATSHAVFRAFDGVDRKRICYVQGTGSSSIVRSLERWMASMKGNI